MNIQLAAQASGLTIDTIRFYEKGRVVPAPRRAENGYRVYTDEHVLILRLANGLRRLGVPLKELAPLLQVAHDGTCGELRQTLSETLDSALRETDRQMQELVEVRQHLVEILQGIDEMLPSTSEVPGLKPCHCVELLTEA